MFALTMTPLAEAVQLSYRDSEMCNAFLVATVSGIAALAVYATSHEHELRNFYAEHNRIMLSAYALCMSIVWVSFAFNARFVCSRFLKILFSPGQV